MPEFGRGGSQQTLLGQVREVLDIWEDSVYVADIQIQRRDDPYRIDSFYKLPGPVEKITIVLGVNDFGWFEANKEVKNA